MWLKCTLCNKEVYGSEGDWGKPCPVKKCEGTLAYFNGFQQFYSPQRQQQQLLRRYFKCSSCKKVMQDIELDRMNPRKCVKCGAVGNLSPI